MTKQELIDKYRSMNPTIKVGSEEFGYTILSPDEYEQTLNYWADLELKRAPTAYIEKRQAEYPPMFDYLDGIVKGDQAQVQAYIDACLAVKAKYPKGG